MGQTAKKKIYLAQDNEQPDERWRLNEYRVEGTFSYLAYCHTSDSGLEECSSFYACEGHEQIKTVNVRQDATSEQEAAQATIEEYRDYYADASWLIGQPYVVYLRSVAERELTVSSYWRSELPERKTIQLALKLRKLTETEETPVSIKEPEL